MHYYMLVILGLDPWIPGSTHQMEVLWRGPWYLSYTLTTSGSTQEYLWSLTRALSLLLWVLVHHATHLRTYGVLEGCRVLHEGTILGAHPEIRAKRVVNHGCTLYGTILGTLVYPLRSPWAPCGLLVPGTLPEALIRP